MGDNSDSDGSESDPFDFYQENTNYPYKPSRVDASEPTRFQAEIPPMVTGVPTPDNYVPRGGGSARNLQIWDSRALTQAAADEYSSFAKGIFTQTSTSRINEERMYRVLHENQYSQTRANYHLMHPALVTHAREASLARADGAIATLPPPLSYTLPSLSSSQSSPIFSLSSSLSTSSSSSSSSNNRELVFAPSPFLSAASSSAPSPLLSSTTPLRVALPPIGTPAIGVQSSASSTSSIATSTTSTSFFGKDESDTAVAAPPPPSSTMDQSEDGTASTPTATSATGAIVGDSKRTAASDDKDGGTVGADGDNDNDGGDDDQDGKDLSDSEYDQRETDEALRRRYRDEAARKLATMAGLTPEMRAIFATVDTFTTQRNHMRQSQLIDTRRRIREALQSPRLRSIDIVKLRSLVQNLADPSSTPLDDDSGIVRKKCSPAHLDLLQKLLQHSNQWHERAKAIFRSKDGMSLTILRALKDEADLTLPLVTCKEKKRLETLVTRSNAWIDKATTLFTDAIGGKKLTYDVLSNCLREAERTIASVYSDERQFLKSAAEFVKSFISTVNERVRAPIDWRNKEARRQLLSLPDAEKMLVMLAERVPYMDIPESRYLAEQVEKAKVWGEDAKRAMKQPGEDDKYMKDIRTLLLSLKNVRLDIPEANWLQKNLDCREWLSKVAKVYRRVQTRGQRGPRLNVLKQLVNEADLVPVPLTIPKHAELLDVVTKAEDCMHEASVILNQKSKRQPLEKWQSLLARLRELPVEMEEESRLAKVVDATCDWFTMARDVLDRNHDGKSPHSLPFEEVEALVSKATAKSIAKIEKNNPELKELTELVHAGRQWSQHVQVAMNSLRTLSQATSVEARTANRKSRDDSISKLRALFDEYKQTVNSDGSIPLLARLRLKLAARVETRLTEMSRGAESAAAALNGPRMTPLADLVDMVDDLRRSGESDMMDPLKTLAKRVEIGVEWKEKAAEMLPHTFATGATPNPSQRRSDKSKKKRTSRKKPTNRDRAASAAASLPVAVAAPAVVMAVPVPVIPITSKKGRANASTPVPRGAVELQPYATGRYVGGSAAAAAAAGVNPASIPAIVGAAASAAPGNAVAVGGGADDDEEEESNLPTLAQYESLLQLYYTMAELKPPPPPDVDAEVLEEERRAKEEKERRAAAEEARRLKMEEQAKMEQDELRNIEKELKQEAAAVLIDDSTIIREDGKIEINGVTLELPPVDTPLPSEPIAAAASMDTKDDIPASTEIKAGDLLDDDSEKKTDKRSDEKEEDDRKIVTGPISAIGMELVDIPELTYIQECIYRCNKWRAYARRAMATGDSDGLARLLTQVDDIGVHVPEMDEIERRSWTERWCASVKNALSRTCPFSELVGILNEYRQRFNKRKRRAMKIAKNEADKKRAAAAAAAAAQAKAEAKAEKPSRAAIAAEKAAKAEAKAAKLEAQQQAAAAAAAAAAAEAASSASALLALASLAAFAPAPAPVVKTETKPIIHMDTSNDHMTSSSSSSSSSSGLKIVVSEPTEPAPVRSTSNILPQIFLTSSITSSAVASSSSSSSSSSPAATSVSVPVSMSNALPAAMTSPSSSGVKVELPLPNIAADAPLDMSMLAAIDPNAPIDFSLLAMMDTSMDATALGADTMLDPALMASILGLPAPMDGAPGMPLPPLEAPLAAMAAAAAVPPPVTIPEKSKSSKASRSERAERRDRADRDDHAASSSRVTPKTSKKGTSASSSAPGDDEEYTVTPVSSHKRGEKSSHKAGAAARAKLAKAAARKSKKEKLIEMKQREEEAKIREEEAAAAADREFEHVEDEETKRFQREHQTELDALQNRIAEMMEWRARARLLFSRRIGDKLTNHLLGLEEKMTLDDDYTRPGPPYNPLNQLRITISADMWRDCPLSPLVTPRSDVPPSPTAAANAAANSGAGADGTITEGGQNGANGIGNGNGEGDGNTAVSSAVSPRGQKRSRAARSPQPKKKSHKKEAAFIIVEERDSSAIDNTDSDEEVEHASLNGDVAETLASTRVRRKPRPKDLSYSATGKYAKENKGKGPPKPRDGKSHKKMDKATKQRNALLQAAAKRAKLERLAELEAKGIPHENGVPLTEQQQKDLENEAVYCFCKRPHIDGEQMIECDECKDWFHATCLYLTKHDVKKVEGQGQKFWCPDCARKLRRPFRFRAKLPSRRAKPRGPKLQSVMACLAKCPPSVMCREVDVLTSISINAEKWATDADVALAINLAPPRTEEETKAALEAEAKLEADRKEEQRLLDEEKAKEEAAEAANSAPAPRRNFGEADSKRQALMSSTSKHRKQRAAAAAAVAAMRDAHDQDDEDATDGHHQHMMQTTTDDDHTANSANSPAVAPTPTPSLSPAVTNELTLPSLPSLGVVKDGAAPTTSPSLSSTTSTSITSVPVPPVTLPAATPSAATPAAAAATTSATTQLSSLPLPSVPVTTTSPSVAPPLPLSSLPSLPSLTPLPTAPVVASASSSAATTSASSSTSKDTDAKMDTEEEVSSGVALPADRLVSDVVAAAMKLDVNKDGGLIASTAASAIAAAAAAVGNTSLNAAAASAATPGSANGESKDDAGITEEDIEEQKKLAQEHAEERRRKREEEKHRRMLEEREEERRAAEERIKRERWKKEREAQSDSLQELLRRALSLPVEFQQRRDVEERTRLLLLLERAERFLIANTLMKPVTARLTERKWQLKEVIVLRDELVRLNAKEYREKNEEQNKVYPRLADLIYRMEQWTNRVNDTLNSTRPVSHKQLVNLQRESRRHFPFCSLPAGAQLNERLRAIQRWMNDEKEALDKRKRYGQLHSLYFRRFNDCKQSESDYTKRIKREVEKVENWQDRLLKAIENKADVATFRALLKETNGNNKVLVDKKDIQAAEQMVNRYCLCEGRWEEGVFMIACDDCDDWFHCDCVNLTQAVAEKIKNYICPNCSKRRGHRYKFGQIPNFDHTPDIKPTTPMKSGRRKRGRSGSRSRSPSMGPHERLGNTRGGHGNNETPATMVLSPRQPRSTRSQHSQRDIERAQSRSPSPSPPRSAPNEGTAASLYATLLYENLHDKVSAENSNVLWHLLNAYMNRPLDARLQEEIIEAVKLVCGEAVLSDALIVVNRLYYTQQNTRRGKKKKKPNKPPPPNMKSVYSNNRDSGSDDDGRYKRKKVDRGGLAGRNAAILRKRKPKGYPRPTVTPFKFFFKHWKSPARKDELAAIMDKDENKGKSLYRVVSEKWRKISKEELSSYEDQTLVDRDRFEREVESWNRSHGASHYYRPGRHPPNEDTEPDDPEPEEDAERDAATDAKSETKPTNGDTTAAVTTTTTPALTVTAASSASSSSSAAGSTSDATTTSTPAPITGVVSGSDSSIVTTSVGVTVSRPNDDSNPVTAPASSASTASVANSSSAPLPTITTLATTVTAPAATVTLAAATATPAGPTSSGFYPMSHIYPSTGQPTATVTHQPMYGSGSQRGGKRKGMDVAPPADDSDNGSDNDQPAPSATRRVAKPRGRPPSGGRAQRTSAVAAATTTKRARLVATAHELAVTGGPLPSYLMEIPTSPHEAPEVNPNMTPTPAGVSASGRKQRSTAGVRGAHHAYASMTRGHSTDEDLPSPSDAMNAGGNNSNVAARGVQQQRGPGVIHKQRPPPAPLVEVLRIPVTASWTDGRPDRRVTFKFSELLRRRVLPKPQPQPNVMVAAATTALPAGTPLPLPVGAAPVILPNTGLVAPTIVPTAAPLAPTPAPVAMTPAAPVAAARLAPAKVMTLPTNGVVPHVVPSVLPSTIPSSSAGIAAAPAVITPVQPSSSVPVAPMQSAPVTMQPSSVVPPQSYAPMQPMTGVPMSLPQQQLPMVQPQQQRVGLSPSFVPNMAMGNVQPLQLTPSVIPGAVAMSPHMKPLVANNNGVSFDVDGKSISPYMAAAPPVGYLPHGHGIPSVASVPVNAPVVAHIAQPLPYNTMPTIGDINMPHHPPSSVVMHGHDMVDGGNGVGVGVGMGMMDTGSVPYWQPQPHASSQMIPQAPTAAPMIHHAHPSHMVPSMASMPMVMNGGRPPMVATPVQAHMGHASMMSLPQSLPQHHGHVGMVGGMPQQPSSIVGVSQLPQPVPSSLPKLPTLQSIPPNVLPPR